MRSFFWEIGQSVSGFGFYTRIKEEKITHTVRYLIIFVTVLSGLFAGRLTYMLNQNLVKGIAWTQENLPVVTIKDGAVSAPVEQPYVKEIEKGVVIIDTTGTVTSLSEYTEGLLLTKHELLYKKSSGETRMYDLRKVDYFKFDEVFMRKAQRWIIAAGFPLLWIVFFFYYVFARFLQVLFMSLFALAIAAAQKTELPYRQLFIVCVYAGTASMVSGLVAGLFGLKIPYFWLVYTGVHIFYVAGALGAIKRVHPGPLAGVDK